ncbi:MAG: hypothetical protein WCI42_05305, partial [Verrucomicrobiota bacterium]
SYVMLAGFIALLAARNVLAGATRPASLLCIFCLALAVENFGHPIFPLTKIWFKPFITSLFVVFLIARQFSILRAPNPTNEDRGTAAVC